MRKISNFRRFGFETITNESMSVGQAIEHPRFGKGKVVRVDQTGNLTVKFTDGTVITAPETKFGPPEIKTGPAFTQVDRMPEVWQPKSKQDSERSMFVDREAKSLILEPVTISYIDITERDHEKDELFLGREGYELNFFRGSMIYAFIEVMATRLVGDKWNLSIKSYYEEQQVSGRQWVCRDLNALGTAAMALVKPIIQKFDSIQDRMKKTKDLIDEFLNKVSDLQRQSVPDYFYPWNGNADSRHRYTTLDDWEIRSVTKALSSMVPDFEFKKNPPSTMDSFPVSWNDEIDIELAFFDSKIGPLFRHRAEAWVIKNDDDEYWISVGVRNRVDEDSAGMLFFKCDQMSGLKRALDGPVAELFRSWYNTVLMQDEIDEVLSLSWLPSQG
jgi:hypothetical protein